MKNRTLNERDLRALRIFRVAAQAGGFAAAEDKLHMTKATISRQIKAVEERLGARLCSRGPKGFELTPAGEAALLYAQEALDALERIFPAVDASRGIISGELNVGITDNAIGNPASMLHRALGELHRAAPRISLTLHTLTSNQIIQSLLERKLDIAVKGVHLGQQVPSLAYLELFTEPHRLYYADHQLASSPRLRPLVFRRQQPFVDDAIQRLGYQRGPEAAGMEAVATLIATGQYVGILPTHYAAMLQSVFPLVPVLDTPEYQVRHYAVTNPSRPLSRAAEKALELLQAAHATG